MLSNEALAMEQCLGDTSWRQRGRAGREILRHFQTRPLASDGIGSDSDETGGQPVNAEQRMSLHQDIVLSAIAHAGAQRLRCRRSFVSLFDQDYQHILAEGINGGVLDGSDPNHILGSRRIDLSMGVCPRTLHFFAKDVPQIHTDTMHAGQDYCHINDLSKEPGFEDHVLMAEYSGILRFYLEVPLRAESGLVLGSYCVVDSAPRAMVSEEEIKYMHGLGRAIMEHLNLLRLKGRFNHADHLIKGLSLFLRGKSTLRDWWLADPDNMDHSQGLTTEERHHKLNTRVDEIFGPVSQPAPAFIPAPEPIAAASNLRPQEDEGSSAIPSTPPTSITSRHAAREHSAARTVSTYSELSVDGLATASSQDLKRGRPSEEKAQVATGAGKKPIFLRDETPRSLKRGNVENDVNAMFTRASNIIREAVELDGAIFLRAPSNEVSTHVFTNEPNNETSSSASTPSSSDNEKFKAEVAEALPIRPSRSNVTKFCDVLGYSLRESFSSAKCSSLRSTPRMEAKTLRHFLSRYQQGTVFSFDRDGMISSGDDDVLHSKLAPQELGSTFVRKEGGSSRLRYERRRDAATISDMIPDVRSVAFFPLWDYSRDRWFAACIAWSLDSNRLLDEDDIAYFAAFANSAMAEVSRMEAILADVTKSNFISSISHEMRSPLHGILGNTELLRDINNNPTQAELIGMIEVCGRTLLDTMDHLLDHAKINHLTLDAKKRGRERSTREHAALGPGQQVDLARLVEDVVTTVYTGHVHSNSSSTLFHMAEDAAQGPQEGESIRELTTSSIHNTMVVVRVDRRSHWSFITQPGEWKRLLMNLFGNALKYTQKGSVLVHLRSENAETKKKNSSDSKKVILSVYDTGRGIAQEYLKYRVFKPFSQENDLDVGAGLGLSIVHQLARSIGANIGLRSEINVGTEVTISVNLKEATSLPTPTRLLQDRFKEAYALCAGKEACFLGFDLLPSMSEALGAELSTQSHQLVLLKSTLLILLKETFGMTATAALSPDHSSASFFFVHESYLPGEAEPGRDEVVQPRQSQPWIVFCKQSTVPRHFGPIRFDIQHPFTSSKIISVILRCLSATNSTGSADNSSKPDESAPALKSNTDAVNTVEPVDDAQEAYIEAQTPHIPTSLPFKDPEGTSPQASALCKVLVVDDNKINVKLLATFIRKLGYEYATATNGLEAVQIYEASSPEYFKVILMDMSMPVMDGFEATRKIRSLEQDKKLQPSNIIALTGLGSTDAKGKASSCGVNMFATKPVGFRQIQQLIKEAQHDSSSRPSENPRLR